MTTERDELAELISCHDSYCYFEDERGSGSECSCGTEICPGLEYAPAAHVGHLTDAILAAGYRKPLWSPPPRNWTRCQSGASSWRCLTAGSRRTVGHSLRDRSES